jgi:hypothetical protein
MEKTAVLLQVRGHYSVTHDFSTDHRIFRYNFGMANTFMVQIRGNAEPCKIEAESITEDEQQNTPYGRIVFKNTKQEVVGSFRSMDVIGWWKLFSA